MVFQALTITRSRGTYWKPRPEAAIFNTSQGTWRMLMQKHVRSRLLHKKMKTFATFALHYFVSLFHRCLAHAISTDYARSRVGQYTSRDGSESVARVRSYWKLRSRALRARELPCYYTAFRRLIHMRHCFFLCNNVEYRAIPFFTNTKSMFKTAEFEVWFYGFAARQNYIRDSILLEVCWRKPLRTALMTLKNFFCLFVPFL